MLGRNFAYNPTQKRSNGHIKSSNHHTQKVELSPNHSNHIIMPSTTSQRMHQQQQQRSDNASISTSPTLNLISVAQRDAILQTQSLKIQQTTRKDHGRNVQLFIAWFQKNYPSQVSSLLIPIQQQQKESIDYPHPQHATHDLNYTSPAITTLMLAYMSYCKLKKNNLGEATGQWIPFVAVILELEETILAKDNSFESKR